MSKVKRPSWLGLRMTVGTSLPWSRPERWCISRVTMEGVSKISNVSMISAVAVKIVLIPTLVEIS